MRVVFTRHALRRMEERGVTREEVYEVLGEPDEVLLDTETSRIIAVKYSTGVCVIVDAHGDRVEVVTVLVSGSLERLVDRRKSRGRWAPWPRRSGQG